MKPWRTLHRDLYTDCGTAGLRGNAQEAFIGGHSPPCPIPHPVRRPISLGSAPIQPPTYLPACCSGIPAHLCQEATPPATPYWRRRWWSRLSPGGSDQGRPLLSTTYPIKHPSVEGERARSILDCHKIRAISITTNTPTPAITSPCPAGCSDSPLQAWRYQLSTETDCSRRQQWGLRGQQEQLAIAWRRVAPLWAALW